jgi:hypothetical protein
MKKSQGDPSIRRAGSTTPDARDRLTNMDTVVVGRRALAAVSGPQRPEPHGGEPSIGLELAGVGSGEDQPQRFPGDGSAVDGPQERTALRLDFPNGRQDPLDPQSRNSGSTTHMAQRASLLWICLVFIPTTIPCAGSSGSGSRATERPSSRT